MSKNSGAEGWIGVAVVGAVAWYWFSDSDWAVQQRAASKYKLPDSRIAIAGVQPHDCDFLTAPIGEKHCSYKREYLVEWITLSSKNRPISYGNMQESPPTACSLEQLDFAHRCYETELQPGEQATPGWHARHVEIRWRKVEE